MMHTAEMLAEKINAQCLVTGESLAQVASQTIENLTVTDGCAKLPILRPLIGMDKEEIIRYAVDIGTYQTSILPYEDCCVLFSPKHPVLHTRRQDAEDIFARINIMPLLAEAFEQRETKKIEWTLP
jgi:probable tRNA sulfurtransferase